MIEDESYSALYLYNALVEYIYFLIILIQDKGPNDLANIAKHVRFFKKDVYTFIQIFNGKDFTEKVSQMLCSATPIFEIKDNVLHLTNNYSYFKQIIYEDFLLSKVVDLVLRGVCRIQDICQNLNFNSIISIKEDILLMMLKYYPYFDFDSNSSVILLQYHGLIGFEKHTYHATVKYFQSYLQNINELTYKDVKLHSSYVPSCAARNSLVIFSILHISPFFKCKKGKISLRNRLKRRHHHEQVINIEETKPKISSSSLPVGLLIHKSFGPMISCWTGEVSSLSSNAGYIQSIVNFTNGYHGIFLIYFYKTALKYACEVGDLRQFLNVCDTIEFDAEFCREAARNEVYWQATRIKVTKHVLERHKYELNLDTEEYLENVNLKNHGLRPLLKVCTVKNCLVEYTVLETENTSNNKLKLNSSRFVTENISVNQDENESEALGVVAFNSNENANPCAKDIDETESACNQFVISSDNNANFNETKTSTSQNVFDNNKDNSHKIDFKKLPKQCSSEYSVHDVDTVPHKIDISCEVKNEEFFMVRTKENSEDDSPLHNVIAEPHETAISHEKKIEKKCSIIRTKLPKEKEELAAVALNELMNDILNAVDQSEVKNENKYSMTRPKLPKEFPGENTSLNAGARNKMKNENKKSIIYTMLPKDCSEKNELKNVVAAPREKAISYEVKNEADCLIKHPKLLKKCSKENELLNAVKVQNETENLYKVKNKNKNLAIHSHLLLSINNTSTFLLGEVAFISTGDIVVNSSFKNKSCEIYFKKDVICFQNAAETALDKGSTVLLFIPFVELDESVLIATFVYPLTSEETIEVQKNGFSVQDFIVNCFSQRVKENLSDTWVCSCDISKSLLGDTQLGPNFKNRIGRKIKYFKFIKKLLELCQLSKETCRSLCSLVNQVCAQNASETCKKLLANSPFSLAKSLSWIKRSKDHTLYILKKEFVNRCKLIARKHRHLSFAEAHKEGIYNTGLIFCTENNIPTTMLKSNSFEDQYCVDDNCNIINLKTPNKLILTYDSVMKQSLEVCHKSDSSAASFSSCLEDFPKESSDDVFYSCESDFDSSPTAQEESDPTNKPVCENNESSVTTANQINNPTTLNTFSNKCSGALINVEQSGLKSGRLHNDGDTSSCLKLRHFSLFKHRRNKSQVTLTSKINFCKICHKPPIEAMAEISILNKSHIYFKIKYMEQNVTLAFPKCLIPIEMLEKIKLNSIVKITVVPHPLINLSRVLHVDFQ